MTSPAYLNALKAFEAAARHQSFSGAAAELNVTAAAVGQQVRSLESWLGIALFDRIGSGAARLVLTQAAREALPDIQEGFARLNLGLARLRDKTDLAELTVGVSPAFAAKWLLPRLEHFRHAHPELNVYLNTNWRIVDFSADQIDIGVRYGVGTWPGLTALHLMRESLFPVCSPSFPLLENGELTSDALSQATLLHDVTAIPDFPGWQHWLTEFGYDNVHADGGLRINNSAAVLQAAIDGQGVALARSVMAYDDLAAGRLIKPFGEQCSTLKQAYYIVFRPDSVTRPKVEIFRDWLLAEAARQS